MCFPEASLLSASINNGLSIVAKQMQITMVIASLFIISIVLVPWKKAYAVADTTALTLPVTTSVKWHPGHYYMLMGNKNNPKYMAQVYSELKETPALRGVLIRYNWEELEPAKGVYNFTSIDQRLAELSARKKRLVILLQTKSFNPNNANVPDYLKTEIYEGGVFAFKRHGTNIVKGHNIKLWNPLVHDRLVELVRALGKRFNSHPYFEGIGLPETAMGKPLVALSSNEIDKFYNNLLSINEQMRKHFPNTMTFQFTNYPRAILKSFTGKLKEMGVALGGPDTFPHDPDLNFKENSYSQGGIYSYYPKLSGIVPLTPSVMQSNYQSTRSDGRGYKPTVSELLTFARDKLKANYIFWTRDENNYLEVLKLLNLPDQKSDPAGGLNASCPRAYSSCIN